MRPHGRVVEIPEPGPADHLCGAYDDARELDAAAADFLEGGPARGERLAVVGDGMIEALTRNTLPFGGTDALLDTGALEILDVGTAYVIGASRLVQRMLLLLGFQATAPVVFDGSPG